MNDPAFDHEAGPSRPLSISVIAVLLVLYGLITLGPKIVLLVSPEIYERSAEFTRAVTSGGLIQLRFDLQIAYSFMASLIMVIAGVFLWRGRNWARWLALGWMALSLGFTLLLTGPAISFFVKIPLFLVLAYFLTTGKASAFLKGESSPHAA